MSGARNEDDPFGYEAEEAEKALWRGDYDGTTCSNCSRVRVILCGNDHRVCEKCRWDHSTGNYALAPEDCP